MDRGLWQEHVATELGVSVSTICNWEGNHTGVATRFHRDRELAVLSQELIKPPLHLREELAHPAALPGNHSRHIEAELLGKGRLAVLPLLTTLSQLWIFAALIGLSGGMITVLFFAVWRQAFGTARLGRIQGAAQMLTVLASAIGPLVFAQCQALTGSYTPALWTLTPCVFLLGLAAFRVPMPRPLQLPAPSPV